MCLCVGGRKYDYDLVLRFSFFSLYLFLLFSFCQSTQRQQIEAINGGEKISFIFSKFFSYPFVFCCNCYMFLFDNEEKYM